MKKTILKLLIALLAVCSLCISVCAASDIKLYVNGEMIITDVSPVAVSNRTMVPVRGIFEKLNADVRWVGSTNQIVITSSDKIIVLKLESKTAYINNEPVQMDVAPMVINQRTLIPVRFISERLGYDVKWDQASMSVYISEPSEIEAPPKKNICITDISVNKGSGKTTVTITGDNLGTPVISTADSPLRYILDFKDSYFKDGDSKIRINNNDITEVRWAEHESYSRVVIESPGKADFSCSYGRDSITVTVTGDYTQSEQPDNPQQSESQSNSNELVKVERPVIVIDAGHGGKDTGAIGYNDDGEAELYEKTANLNIALGVKKYLEQNGVYVVMTRSDDSALDSEEMSDLLKRSEIANNADATFFVSIHNNSFSDPSASGTLVLYADSDSKINYGVTSKQLAQNILTPLVDALGLQNRGVVESPKMVVLRKTNMPSVLIECAFVSCPGDRDILNDNEKIDEIAYAISQGILKSISQLP